jgi:hypothetical protein
MSKTQARLQQLGPDLYQVSMPNDAADMHALAPLCRMLTRTVVMPVSGMYLHAAYGRPRAWLQSQGPASQSA